VTTQRSPGAVLVLLELDLGSTFCGVALASQNAFTARRNIENARKALECAVRYQPRVILTAAERKSFNSKKEKLEALLLAADSLATF
jgi:hypothetical protein